MVRFPEAITRLYSRVYVCRRCKKKARVNIPKVIAKKYVCKKCGGKAFRPIKRQKAVVAK